VKPRSVYIHRKATGAMSEEISILSSHYEPLQYPLLFPHGTPGWSPNLRPKISQITWYRFRLLSESRFCDLGRLGNEYLVDMYSRVEEERLNFIQQGRKDQLNARQCRRELDVANNPNLSLPAELPGPFSLPSSFIGSRAWASENVSESLAICKELGSPTFFATATTNPNWPEIVSRLKPGQTASDIPFMVARVFRARMARCLDFIRSHFGKMIYIIKVIEFQKRGFPHAHFVFKVNYFIPHPMHFFFFSYLGLSLGELHRC